MEGSTLLNLAAIGLSALALAASVATARRQSRLQHNANQVPIILEMFREFRSGQFHRDHLFLTQELQAMYSPDDGIRGLPQDVQDRIYNIVYFYQHLATLPIFGIVDSHQLIPPLHARIISVWDAVEPFVRKERQFFAKGGPYLLAVLENWATQARELPEDSLGLMIADRRRGPRAIPPGAP